MSVLLSSWFKFNNNSCLRFNRVENSTQEALQLSLCIFFSQAHVVAGASSLKDVVPQIIFSFLSQFCFSSTPRPVKPAAFS
jgi:hypothetical protein